MEQRLIILSLGDRCAEGEGPSLLLLGVLGKGRHEKEAKVFVAGTGQGRGPCKAVVAGWCPAALPAAPAKWLPSPSVLLSWLRAAPLGLE